MFNVPLIVPIFPPLTVYIYGGEPAHKLIFISALSLKYSAPDPITVPSFPVVSYNKI